MKGRIWGVDTDTSVWKWKEGS